MAWTSMHFAVGMGCAGAACAAVCFVARRGWRWLPGVMTLGGLWACVPDMPRLFRVDFPGLGLADSLGSKTLEHSLHAVGDLFFFHKQLDAQPHEFALHGLFLTCLLYNLAIAQLMWMEHRQRQSVANRAWRAHGERMTSSKQGRRRRRRRVRIHPHAAPTRTSTSTSPSRSAAQPPADASQQPTPEPRDDAPVLFTIRPSRHAEGQ